MIKIRRKVVLHGPSSLSISLPSEWVKKNNILKGDEVDLAISHHNLIIKPGNTIKEIKKKEISIIGLSDQSALDLITSLYKRGYDELIIEFDKSDFIKVLHKYINSNLLGFEIIKQSKEELVVKSISDYKPDEFDNLLRRLFLITIEYANKIHEIMQDGNDDMTLNYLLHQISINRISNLCQRMIVKDEKQNPILHGIILSINRIGDVFSEVIQEIKNDDSELTHNIIHKYSELKELFYCTYELYYKFSIGDYEKILKNADNTQKSLQRADEMNTKTCKYNHLLVQLNYRIRDILDPILAMRI